MKLSKKQVRIAVIALAGVVVVTYVSSQTVAIAGPTFLNGRVAVMRVPEQSETATTLSMRSQYVPLPVAVLDQNPKLKEAIAGADVAYEANSKISPTQLAISYDPVYEVDLAEDESNSLRSMLVIADERQETYDDYVAKYHYSHIEYAGRLYEVTIITAGK